MTLNSCVLRHILIAFGAPNGGLEEAIEADEDLKVGEENANELFDLFIQPLTSGTRSIRLEVNKNNNTFYINNNKKKKNRNQ